ncbi:hypothetical protein CK203_070360 [Vitis vinifera]|uniref:Uncharacterized protein n=1 Tax=Vitis vinifera TaxID=29760 RepID=A0A438E6Q4_VITVI|nr:hypothetical protein CK203_070360 [Vitis vinifera]
MIENVVVPVATGYGLAERVCIFEKPRKELEKLALETGFSHAKHYEIGGGIMGT